MFNRRRIANLEARLERLEDKHIQLCNGVTDEVARRLELISMSIADHAGWIDALNRGVSGANF